eukprot:6302030-Pyramimonas_sp.AAC.1
MVPLNKQQPRRIKRVPLDPARSGASSLLHCPRAALLFIEHKYLHKKGITSADGSPTQAGRDTPAVRSISAKRQTSRINCERQVFKEGRPTSPAPPRLRCPVCSAPPRR